VIKDIERLASCACMPFGAGQPEVFRGAVPPSLLSLDEAGGLYRDSAHRNGEVVPGHRRVVMVVGNRMLDPLEFSDPVDAARLIADGAVVLLKSLQTYVPAVRVVCQDLANATGRPVIAQGLWMPPNHRGMRTFDMRLPALISVQAGKWQARLYRPVTTDPEVATVATEEDARQLILPPAPDYAGVIQQGDLLAIPSRWLVVRPPGPGESLTVMFMAMSEHTDPQVAQKQRAVVPED